MKIRAEREVLPTDPERPVGLAAGETITWAGLFRSTGVDTTSPVYAAYDVTDTATNGGDVTIQFNTPANGAALKGA